MREFIPDRGDCVWINFDPQIGREQAGRRPALVISHRYYNANSRLLICCPITSRIKSYPFEVRIPEGQSVRGVVLADHVKSFDWRLREAEFICSVPPQVVSDVIAKFQSIIAPVLT